MLTLARYKIVWAASLALAIATQSAWGQYPVQQPMGRYQKPNPQGQQQPYQKPNNLNKGPIQIMTSGTIEAITGNGLQVDANGTKMLVAGDKNCKVEVTGTADASFLKPGMLVRFNGDVDKKTGKTTAAVSAIEVISPQVAMSGDEPQGGANPKTRLKGKKAAAQAPASGIVGHLKEVKANEITVETPGGTVKAELSPTASVKVNVTDPHMAQQLAQVGDKIDIHGYSTQPPKVIAQEMRITLAGSGEKKPGPKPNEKPAAAAAN